MYKSPFTVKHKNIAGCGSFLTSNARGENAIFISSNNIFALSLTPLFVDVFLIFPNDVKQDLLKEEIKKQIEIANFLNIKIGTLDVSYENVSSLIIMATCIAKNEEIKKEVGEHIFLVGDVGKTFLSNVKKENATLIKERFNTHFLNGIVDIYEDKTIFNKVKNLSSTTYIKPLDADGFFSNMYELSKVLNRGFVIDMEKVSIKQETIELADHLSLNPYEVDSTGAFLILSNDVKLSDKTKDVRLIGHLSNNKDMIIGTKNGDRHLERPSN